MKAYIYSIINTINGQRYVGQTLNIAHRMEEHFSALKNNSHHSHKLQRAYNKYGVENFKVEYAIVSLKDYQELDLLEIKEIEKYDSYFNGYNETFGGEGSRRKFSYSDSVLLYNLLQRYDGIARKLSRYYNCDQSVFKAIRNNHAIFSSEPVDEAKLLLLVSHLGLQDDNLKENYQPHNKKKLTRETCLELLSVITQCQGYDHSMCQVLQVNSKVIWRLKQGLIYKPYIEEFQQMTLDERESLKNKTLEKYSILGLSAQRKRAGTKNQLTQEQINYILDHQQEKRTSIARTLGISADRVSSVILGKSYKDLVANYYSSKQ